jgi:hypothetical protein
MPYKKLVFPGPKPAFSPEMKAKIAMEVMTGKLSCLVAAKTYQTAPGNIHHWIRNYHKFAVRPTPHSIMAKGKKKHPNGAKREVIHVPKTVEELQEALRFAQLKITALETLIDTAEQELSILIRKKPDAKQ